MSRRLPGPALVVLAASLFGTIGTARVLGPHAPAAGVGAVRMLGAGHGARGRVARRAAGQARLGKLGWAGAALVLAGLALAGRDAVADHRERVLA